MRFVGKTSDHQQSDPVLSMELHQDQKCNNFAYSQEPGLRDCAEQNNNQAICMEPNRRDQDQRHTSPFMEWRYRAQEYGNPAFFVEPDQKTRQQRKKKNLEKAILCFHRAGYWEETTTKNTVNHFFFLSFFHETRQKRPRARNAAILHSPWNHTEGDIIIEPKPSATSVHYAQRNQTNEQHQHSGGHGSGEEWIGRRVWVTVLYVDVLVFSQSLPWWSDRQGSLDSSRPENRHGHIRCGQISSCTTTKVWNTVLHTRGCLVGWLVACLVACLVGWLVGCPKFEEDICLCLCVCVWRGLGEWTQTVDIRKDKINFR